MPRCASPGPSGHRCAGQLSHCLMFHEEGDGAWPLYAAERTALAIVERLQLQGHDRVRTYAATLEQLNREEEAREGAAARALSEVMAAIRHYFRAADIDTALDDQPPSTAGADL